MSMPASSNGGFLQPSQSPGASSSVLPPWLSTTSNPSPSPSVTLSLSPLTVQRASPIPWLPPEKQQQQQQHHSDPLVSELMECCGELEKGYRDLTAHRKEAAWRLKRAELELESEKASKKREKSEEIEARIRDLREEQRAALDRIENECREQLARLRREAEAKEQKLDEQWRAKHLNLVKFVEQMSCRSFAGAHEPPPK
ncbi:hypothetical protein M569_03306 [Genlisea aurea]|uniref:Uncharacterized protein n=1 Tax=Genlisea aurea TaxID=192259 RepID=S8E6K1_9LAMI|nr:hypothetical protein M569_03306 [Genlisea aurea]